MTAELGGFTGIVEPDAETVRFLRERRGVDFAHRAWMRSDAGARYAERDPHRLRRAVADGRAPRRPGQRPAAGRAAPSARASTSPTAARAPPASARTSTSTTRCWPGPRSAACASRRASRCTCSSAPRTCATTACARATSPPSKRSGAELLQPACGACANCGPGASTRAEQVTVSAINRNFPGRSGPGQVWLASPPTVAASAIAGELVSFGELAARG